MSKDKHHGIHIENEPIRGTSYNDSLGQICFYRTIRAYIVNDTTIPVNLNIQFSNKYTELLPKTNRKFKVFLLPATYQRDNLPSTFLINNESEKPLELNKTIQPGDSCTLDLEFFFNSNSTTGITRSINLRSISNNVNRNSSILLDVSLESNNGGVGIYTSTILCGHLTF